MKSSFWPSLGLLLGRVFISLLFIIAGISKVMNYEGTSKYMTAKGMTMVPLFLIGAMLCEIVGGMSVLLGLKARYGALLLILFLIPTTAIFHDFWFDPSQQTNFMKNLAIWGGLFYVLSVGAGEYSLDAFLHRGKSHTK